MSPLPVAYAGRMVRSLARRRPVPVFASIYPTFRCNLRCVYCNFPGMMPPESELTTDEWKGVIDALAAHGCRRVSILGGEPLLREDLAEIIGHVRRRGLSCALTSNGLLVPERIGELRGLSTLVLSLDAAGPANDEVRGRGSFEAVKKSIEAARRSGIPVKINSVLSGRTAPELDGLLEFVDRNDLSVTLNVMRSGTPALWRDAASVKESDGDIRRLLLRLAELAKRNPRILFSEATYRFAARWDDYSRDRYEKSDFATNAPLLRSAPRCRAGRCYLTILSDGSVTPCMNTIGQIKGGNVVADGFAAAWRSLRDHDCLRCYAPCLVELDHLFSLRPRVVLNFVLRHLRRYR
ncbi:MAG: radical SAM protein [Candidatus Aminicenantes bacterium]|nr:radical SAM protein [Candidatus Aminicenantes bacterium]